MSSDAKQQILDAVERMGGVHQLLFIGFLEAAFVHKTVPAEVAEARMMALVARHDAGEKLTAGDVESIGAQVSQT
ncbi:hypothetical protein [Paenirhodobacter sp. CAU 1674]|uniref:hypothetical protein n=1 Tax=Paenirhodobacter sp. CAU 1674 TaxID=3032596 RepID=UPI0023DC320A|nr:hypothetical protein [Paenirhodobacter sp. CAU 1674]MDF2140813.1 hypothetical protein [Paenirhodobacter sp. CAU 1674]